MKKRERVKEEEAFSEEKTVPLTQHTIRDRCKKPISVSGKERGAKKNKYVSHFLEGLRPVLSLWNINGMENVMTKPILCH